MSCTSKLQQKYLQREWPEDWQNQFLKLKKVWSNKIKTTENIEMPRPIYINTFDSQILSEYVKSESGSSISIENASRDYCEHKQKINKERENKMSKEAITNHKRILDEIPYFVEILRQLNDKITNLLEISGEDSCRNSYIENKPIQKRKRRPKRKYKLNERYYRTETSSIRSTSPESEHETESIISSDDYTNYKSVGQEGMKLSIVHNMPEINSKTQYSERKSNENFSIKINYVDGKFQCNRQTPQNRFSNTVGIDDVNKVSSNCLLIPLIANIKRPEQ